jgi:hypothetical protein
MDLFGPGIDVKLKEKKKKLVTTHMVFISNLFSRCVGDFHKRIYGLFTLETMSDCP